MSDQLLIVVVEDDKSIAELIRYNLESESYRVLHFENGSDMFDALATEKNPISLFILDVMLPGQDGFEICETLKKDEKYRWSSFLFLTARSSETDKVEGFRVGADDFLTKPFGMRELLARVKALVSRNQERLALLEGKVLTLDSGNSKIDSTKSASVQVGGVLLDDARHRVYVNDQEIEMTHREYELLKFLMTNKGLAFTRDDLLNHVWGYEYSGETRTVDVHIRQLRRKIEENPSEPLYIQTVRGVGYRFQDKE
ncbi:MAG: response regulator transcription factor [Clostridiaceae bacterium]|nr:response regulator transcription factor [Clostridiaceae bacterium]